VVEKAHVVVAVGSGKEGLVHSINLLSQQRYLLLLFQFLNQHQVVTKVASMGVAATGTTASGNILLIDPRLLCRCGF
jgi:hypothetical protein